jgi:ribosomal-protein-alanine N-acetyltransferase
MEIGSSDVQAFRPYRVDQRVYELGFHLCRRYWGQGLAKEAARAVTDYGCDTLGVDAMFAGHHPANAASRGLLLKLGFVHTHEEFYEPTGRMHPSYLLRRQ